MATVYVVQIWKDEQRRRRAFVLETNAGRANAKRTRILIGNARHVRLLFACSCPCFTDTLMVVIIVENVQSHSAVMHSDTGLTL